MEGISEVVRATALAMVLVHAAHGIEIVIGSIVVGSTPHEIKHGLSIELAKPIK